MPLYEYQCESCAHRFERIQKYSDPPIETCPSCGGKVKKLLSSPAIQFKGSGWYITDYAKAKSSDGKSSNAGKESGEGSTGTAAESTTKDSKDSSAPAPAKPSPSKTE